MKQFNAALMTLMTFLSLYITYDMWRMSRPQSAKTTETSRPAPSANAGLVPESQRKPPEVKKKRESFPKGNTSWVPDPSRLVAPHLLLHECPDPLCPVLLAIPNQRIVLRATGRVAFSSDDSLWREIVIGGCTGWVYSDFIRPL
jgi:hypothetical protein